LVTWPARSIGGGVGGANQQVINVAVACLWVIPDRRIDRAVRDHGALD
jgi:hypothetical protein